jgi:hypothetical protein
MAPPRAGHALAPLLVATSLVVPAGSATGTSERSGATRLTRPAAQALRTCVDRWNQGNMRDWGPALASVGVRRLDGTRLRALGLPFGPRRCVVTVAFEYRLGPGERCSPPSRLLGRKRCVDRSGTWSCAIDRFGAYVCPLRHEPDRVALRNENAMLDGRGVLRLDAPLSGTRPPRRLAWQRYPRIDGFVYPWTRAGTLRAGLTFTSTYPGGGTCGAGSEEVGASFAVRCVWHGQFQVQPCFAPPRWWNHRGAVVACPNGAGATTFGRFVIGGPRYEAIAVGDLIPWTAAGAIALGESRGQVARELDAAGHRYHVHWGYYVLRGGRLFVTFQDGRVNELAFATPYYVTWDGFSVGSRIPLGPCHRAARTSCEHRWRGFVWNAWVKDKPCSCWVKVGDGARSLPATGANFLKHWVFLYVRHGRVTRILMSRRFVD